MDKREAEAYRRLQDENIKLRQQLEAFQDSKAETAGEESPPPTKGQFDKMNYHKRVAFKEQYPELYKQYTK